MDLFELGLCVTGILLLGAIIGLLIEIKNYCKEIARCCKEIHAEFTKGDKPPEKEFKELIDKKWKKIS